MLPGSQYSILGGLQAVVKHSKACRDSMVCSSGLMPGVFSHCTSSTLCSPDLNCMPETSSHPLPKLSLAFGLPLPRQKDEAGVEKRWLYSMHRR